MPDARTSETRAIYLAETAQPDLGEVTACLQDESESVRVLAAAVLGRLGPPAVASLIQGLAKTQPVPVRSAAACGLAAIGPDAVPAISELCRCLTADDDGLRDVAAVALGKIGSPAIPALQRMRQFSNPLVVDAAVSALNAIGPPDASVLPDLERDMAHPDPATRKSALKKTAQLRQAAHPAIPRILALTRDPDPAVRAEACLTLGRIEAPPGQIYHALTDPSPDVRFHAVITFKAWESHLEPCLTDPDPRVVAAAEQIRGKASQPPTSPG